MSNLNIRRTTLSIHHNLSTHLHLYNLKGYPVPVMLRHRTSLPDLNTAASSSISQPPITDKTNRTSPQKAGPIKSPVLGPQRSPLSLQPSLPLKALILTLIVLPVM